MNYSEKHYKNLLSIIENDFGIEVKKLKKNWKVSAANCWSRNNQYIKIGIYCQHWYEVIGALVHEFGHCQSVLKRQNVSGMLYFLYRFKAPLTKKQKLDIITEERRAWRLGFKLMRDSGIEVNKDLLKFRVYCVNSHKKYLFRKMGR